MENGYIESFPGKFREECPNEHWFLTLEDARETIESWRIDYNQVRPHSALGYLTPEEFATGYANVESTDRFPHSHNFDGCYGLNLQLSSNPSALTYPDSPKGAAQNLYPNPYLMEPPDRREPAICFEGFSGPVFPTLL
jgi:hypothetical protein